jgi:hypothetical protein
MDVQCDVAGLQGQPMYCWMIGEICFYNTYDALED